MSEGGFPYDFIFITARTGIEPVIPPWEGGVLTPWPTSRGTFLIIYYSLEKSKYYFKVFLIVLWIDTINLKMKEYNGKLCIDIQIFT